MAQLHAQTETAVANEALSHLLLPAIVDLDADTSQSGRVLRKHFAAVRDAMMRQYPWNCCEREKTLTVDPDAEVSVQFAYSYVLPNTPYCLAARRLWQIDRRMWKLRGRNIVTNCGPTVTLIYTALIADVSQWDALFRNAFALALAVACKELCKDEEVVETVQKAAGDALAAAWPVDAAEGTPDEMPVLDVIAIRDSYGSCSRRPREWDDC